MKTRTFMLTVMSATFLLAGGFVAGCDLEDLCGNSTLDEGEDCDDGNTDDGDGCSAACLTEDNSGEGEGEGAEGEGEGAEGEGEGEGGMEGEGEGGMAYFGWLRICSKTTKDDSNYDARFTGPDVDAIALFDANDNLLSYADAHGGSDNSIQATGNERGDANDCLGEPNATARNSDGNDLDDCKGFTSIGLKGHYIYVSFEDDNGDQIEVTPGMKIQVYEVPNCSLDTDPGALRAEPSRLDLSIATKDERWVELQSDFAGGESTAIVVPADDGGDHACEPCGGAANCTP